MSGTKGLSIAIIGGGASAALVLAHLARQPHAGKIARITISDREGLFARGVAYSTKNPVHLLNVRANSMSAFPAEADHLVLWLKENGHVYKETDFIPRMVYAQYLQHLWDDAFSGLKAGGCVVDLSEKNIQKSDADITVMATGNAVPVAPRGAENLSEKDGYHAHPWNIDYGKVTGDVIVAGTGLSMIDTVMALHAFGFTGNITAISRNGLIPAAHVDPASYPPFFDNEFPKTVLGLLREIRTYVAKAEQKNIPWQAVIDSLRAATNPIWLSLSEKEKAKMRRLMPFWNIHRHRMASEVADVIGKLKTSSQLKIIKDRIENVAKGIAVTGRKGTYKAGTVINCLGYKSDKSFIYRPGMEKEGFFALGPVLSDYYFETTAMPEIRVQAERVAKEILQR